MTHKRLYVNEKGRSVTWVTSVIYYQRLRMERFAFLQISREIVYIYFWKLSKTLSTFHKKV